MYLLQNPPKTSNKWRMGRLGYGYQPDLPFIRRRGAPPQQPIIVKLAGVGYGYQQRLGDGSSESAQGWRRGMGRLGLNPVRLPNLGALGAASGPACVYYAADGSTVESTDYNSNLVECGVNGGTWTGTPALNTPTLPAGAQNPSPVAGGASNGGITTVMATQPSSNPLDYTSPQAAIAAGLDPQTVYNAWSAALSRFPSPQAAISAGVPAGVVNQLWQSAHVTAATTPAPSIGMGTIVLGAGLLFGLSLLGGRRGMR